METNQKINFKRLIIPVFIPGLIILSIFIYWINDSRKCKRLLKENDCISVIVNSYYSEEHTFGNGSRGVSTGFYIETTGEKFKVTTDGFAKPIPIGTPIVVRYSPHCPDCSEILWDSVFVSNGSRYRYFYITDKGYDYSATEIQIK